MGITLDTLDELEDYINHLDERFGLKPETIEDFQKAIAKKRKEEKVRKLKKDILDNVEMMTIEEAISRLPDDLNEGVRQYLIEKSQTESPLLFAITLQNAMRENFFDLKPKKDS